MEEDISEDEEQIKTFINTNVTAKTKVVLTGACTSNNIGESLGYEFTKMLNCSVELIVTADLVINLDYFIGKDANTILVAYAKSSILLKVYALMNCLIIILET